MGFGFKKQIQTQLKQEQDGNIRVNNVQIEQIVENKDDDLLNPSPEKSAKNTDARYSFNPFDSKWDNENVDVKKMEKDLDKQNSVSQRNTYHDPANDQEKDTGIVDIEADEFLNSGELNKLNTF